MSFSMEDLTHSLLEALECPVCVKYYSVPILQCIQGHCICKECRVKLDKCPTCKSQFSNARNFALENLLSTTWASCVNRSSGCPTRLYVCDLANHEKICLYNTVDCLIGSCTWSGSIIQLAGHATHIHKESFWKQEITKVTHRNCYTECSYVTLIEAHGELFWYHFRISEVKRALYVAVQQVAPVEGPIKYKYTIKMSSPDGLNSWIVSRRVYASTKNISNVFKFGQCVHITFDAMKFQFKHKDHISFNLIIKKI